LKLSIASLKKHKTIHNVAALAMGTAGAQAIGIAFSPIITRLYGPEAFGLLGTFLALITILTPLAALSYPIAIVLPKHDAEARALSKISIYISLGIAGIISIALLVKGNLLLDLLGATAISAFKFLIPVNILFAAWLQIVEHWLIRKKLFVIKAKTAVVAAALINSAKTGVGLFHPLAAVLVVISSISAVVRMVLLYFGLSKTSITLKSSNQEEEKMSLGAVAKHYRDFPLYRSPQIFINTISQSLPVLLLAAFFGPAAAGFYTLTKKILTMPTKLIGKSVGSVFYPRSAEAAIKGENLFLLVLKATLLLAAIGAIPFAVIIIFGPSLFSFAFGSEWLQAGEYAQWLSVMLFVQFINKPAVSVIPVIGKQKGLLVYEVFSTGSKLIVLYIGFSVFRSDILSIALFSVAGASAYLILILWVMFILRKRERRKNAKQTS
jgi:O-antigen/teichoic acid export membrane protein